MERRTFSLAGGLGRAHCDPVFMRGVIVFLLLGMVTAWSAVEPGMARVNVLQELGTPASAIKRGDTEVLSYKGGVRITLKAGRVVEVSGLSATELAVPVAPTPVVEAEAAHAEEPEEPPATKEQLAALEKMEREAAADDAKARAEMEKAILELENMGENEAEVAEPTFQVSGFLLELVVKWLMTLAALKLATKYWNSDVPWNGLMLVAVVDVIIRGVIGYIGYGVLEMMSLFYADEAVAALVMVGLLRKVSINQRLSLAIEVVLTTKVFSIVVGSFVVTVLMRTLF